MDNEDLESVELENFGGDGVDYSAYFVTEEDFDTYKAAYNWANSVARGFGFFLGIVSHKRNANGPQRVYFKCRRGASKPKRQVGDLDDFVRENTRTQYCGCKFTLKAQMAMGTGLWNVIAIEGEYGMHNHELMIYKEGYRECSGLSDESKELVRAMSENGIEPNKILLAVRRKFPQISTTIKHIYNYRQKIKVEERDGMTVVHKFLHDAYEAGYVQHIEKEEGTNQLTHAFLAHPISVQLLRTYPWVIGIDSTYRTNRYKMPFVEMIGVTSTNRNFLIAYALIRDETEASYWWVLHKLRNLLGSSVHPAAIVTDRELGLFKPIRDLFPHSSHLLCTWHINACVEKYVDVLFGKKQNMGRTFKNGKWYNLMHAATEEKYCEAFQLMTEVWNPVVIKYVVDTWLPFKEMFVFAWTNQVLHFGTRTTCRVESAHSCLKGWLESSTLALDSIWKRVHMMIEGQLINIRSSLEKCRQGTGRQYFSMVYDNIRYKVSPNCLQEIRDEIKRMEALGDTVVESCGCVITMTHGLPCACRMKTALKDGRGIYLNQVHMFWQRVIIGSEVGNAAANNEDDEDLQTFRRLSQEVEASDPAVVRCVNMILSRKLHPDLDDIEEPNVNEKLRGRPRKGQTSTRREPSSFELGGRVSSRGRRGKSRGSEGQSQVNSSSRPSRGMSRGSDPESQENSSSRGCWKDHLHSVPLPPSCTQFTAGAFSYKQQVPDKILRYVEGYLDVRADGNCGFRCVASAFHDDEDNWALVRHILSSELLSYPVYCHIYTGTEMVERAVNRIEWSSGPCGVDHWMLVHDDLFPIATAYNCAVMYFSLDGRGRPSNCCTVLPLRSAFDGPCGEIVIVHLGSYPHFIRLYLKPNFPVPTIHAFWRYHHLDSVHGWDEMYSARIAKWRKLYPVQDAPSVIDCSD